MNDLTLTPEEQLEALLREAGLPVRPCGLNADWCVEAWHVGPGDEPNRVGGDVYVLDNERGEGTFDVVRCWYDLDRGVELESARLSPRDAVALAKRLVQK